MMHSGKREANWNGEIFYINDGVPKTTLFLIRPFYRGVMGKEYNPLVMLPVWTFVALSWTLNMLSWIIGKRFQIPFWGATYMEAVKVLRISTNL